MRRRWLIVLGMMGCAVAPLTAQRAPMPAEDAARLGAELVAAASCLESLPPRVLRRAVARLQVQPVDARDTAVAFAIGFLAEDLGTALRARLGGSDAMLAPADSFLDWRVLRRAEVGLVITPTAVVWQADATTPPGVVRMLAPLLDSLMLSPPMLAWPEGTTERTARARLRLVVPPFDSLGRPVVTPGLSVAAEGPPVFTLAHPWHTPVMVAAGGLRGIRYPEFANRNGIGGVLDVTLVVDRSGRAMRGTIEDLRRPRFAPGDADLAEAYDRFRQSVVAALERARFVPATIGGCAVPERVPQRFLFGVARD